MGMNYCDNGGRKRHLATQVVAFQTMIGTTVLQELCDEHASMLIDSCDEYVVLSITDAAAKLLGGQ
jgi:hypothetical protein